MTASDTDSIGEYLISSRDLDEYRAMFTLTDADLAGSILDCPGGGASFTATARAQGTDAHAVDPVYAAPSPTSRRSWPPSSTAAAPG